jgi:hypothetical protein
MKIINFSSDSRDSTTCSGQPHGCSPRLVDCENAATVVLNRVAPHRIALSEVKGLTASFAKHSTLLLPNNSDFSLRSAMAYPAFLSGIPVRHFHPFSELVILPLAETKGAREACE